LISLRDYQVKALDAIWSALQVEHNILLSAACSAGKTVVFAKIIQRLIAENPSFRCMILVDREILITQSRDKLIKVAPELQLSIGIACASVTADKDHSKPVTIASRQTLINHLNQVEPVQLLIVDEVHLVGIPKEGKKPDQFGKIIETLREYNPKMRLLGVTATPYRLGDGYIYGDKNAPGCMPYFNEMHHTITVGELQEQGFLCPLKGKTVAPSGMMESLGNVGMVGGEYNLGALSDLMIQGLHINSAVEAWQEYAQDRKKTLAFCVTIEHAERLAEAFNAADIPAIAIHSELSPIENAIAMSQLTNGGKKVFCSVAKLTTGMDVEDIDCILMCRPTKSTALYKQKLGRGQRIAPGKVDCLVLDMVGNNGEFGTDLDNLKVSYKRATGKDGKPLSKVCPACDADIHPACRFCPECDYEYPAEDRAELDRPDMVDADYGYQPPVKMAVAFMEVDTHVSKSSGKQLLRIRLELESEDSFQPISASLWMCFEGDGYTGYAVQKGRALWDEMTVKRPYPSNCMDAKINEEWILQPDFAVVNLAGKYPEIKEVEYDVPF